MAPASTASSCPIGQRAERELDNVGDVGRLALALQRDRGELLGVGDEAIGYALHRPRFVVQDLVGREAGIDFHTQCFSLLAQPPGNAAQADDAVAAVDETLRQQVVRDGGTSALAKKDNAVCGDGGIKWCAALLPIGKEFGQRPWGHYRAGQDMGTNYCTFFDQAHRNVVVFLGSELLHAYRRCQSGLSIAHDQYVKHHEFSLHFPSFLW